MASSGLGSLLVSEGLLTEGDRRTIANTCGSSGAAFAKGVVDLGLLDEDDLASFLAERTRYDFADKMLGPDPGLDVTAILNLKLLARLEVLPIRVEEGVMTVAMADPLDGDTIRQLEFFTGLKIKPIIATFFQIHEGLRNLDPEFAAQPSGLSEFLTNHVDAAARRLRVRDNLHIDTLPPGVHPASVSADQAAVADASSDDYLIIDDDVQVGEGAGGADVDEEVPDEMDGIPGDSGAESAAAADAEESVADLDLGDMEGELPDPELKAESLGEESAMEAPAGSGEDDANPFSSMALEDLPDNDGGETPKDLEAAEPALDLEPIVPEALADDGDSIDDSLALENPGDLLDVGGSEDLETGLEVDAAEGSGSPGAMDLSSEEAADDSIGADLDVVSSDEAVTLAPEDGEPEATSEEDSLTAASGGFEALDDQSLEEPTLLDLVPNAAAVEDAPPPPLKLSDDDQRVAANVAAINRGIVALSLALNAKKAASAVADAFSKMGCSRGFFALAQEGQDLQVVLSWDQADDGADLQRGESDFGSLLHYQHLTGIEEGRWLPVSVLEKNGEPPNWEGWQRDEHVALVSKCAAKKGGHAVAVVLWPKFAHEQVGMDEMTLDLLRRLSKRF